MIEIFSDGGSRGNPGKAAAAYLIKIDGEIVKTGSFYLEVTTNNIAEYTGAIEGIKGFIEYCKDNEKLLNEKILFKMDSELVVKQLNGQYKVKDLKLVSLWERLKQIVKDNNLNITFQHIPRKENAYADKLVNEKLDDSSRL